MADDNAAATNAGAQGQPANGADTTNTNPASGQPAASQPGKTALTGAEVGKPAPGNEPGNKGGEGADGKPKEGDAKGTPETYAEFKLPDNMPEGMQVDKALIDSFVPLAKEMNLSQENAQKLVDLYSSRMLEQGKSLVDNHIAQVDQWRQSQVKDAEIAGTNGQQYEANVKIAAQAFAKFGTPELGKLLEDTGIGDHPELVRFGLRIGKAISEDSMTGLGGGNPANKGQPKTAAERLYGNQQS